MRHLGFDDARCTGAGTDGGVDVRSREAVAQVKAQLTPVGRPELQALYGVARSEGRRPLFFSLMSYTTAALTWADEVGMPLFRFDHAGLVEAVNAPAEALLVAAGGPGSCCRRPGRSGCRTGPAGRPSPGSGGGSSSPSGWRWSVSGGSGCNSCGSTTPPPPAGRSPTGRRRWPSTW